MSRFPPQSKNRRKSMTEQNKKAQKKGKMQYFNI